VNLRDQYPPNIPFWSRHTLTEKLDSKVGRKAVMAALELVKPELVVVDPIAFFFQGSESDPVTVQNWLDIVNEWRESAGCAVILCHHDRQSLRFPTKSGLSTLDAGMDDARGSSRLPAWADFVAGMKRKDEQSILRVQKVRDQEDEQEFTFVLRDGKLVLTERSDTIGEFVLNVVGPTEWWLSAVVNSVSTQMDVSGDTVRRTINKLVSRGALVQKPIGARFKIKKAPPL